MTDAARQKTADDHMLYQPFGIAPWSRLMVSSQPYQGHIDRLRATAAVLTQQIQEHEAYRMAQTVENLGGPGTGRMRYMRSVLSNPYQVNPLLPYMGSGVMGPLGPMGMPGGMGVDSYTSPDIDLPRPGQPDPELTALEQGITRTASVHTDATSQALAKLAAESYGSYEAEIPQQYVDAVSQPGRAQQAGAYTASAASHLGQGIGDAAMATGYGLRAAGGAVGNGLSSFARGVRDFLNTEPQGGQRWGAGAPPAGMTNEYGQPIYG